MKEIGRVIENKNNISLVEVGGAYCESCASNEKCVFHKERNKLVEAENLLDAKPGDLVILEVTPKKYIFSTFLIYLFPIISMFLGAIIGEYLFKIFYFRGENISSIIFAFLFLFISILTIKGLNKIFFFRPKIEEIVDEEILKNFNKFTS